METAWAGGRGSVLNEIAGGGSAIVGGWFAAETSGPGSVSALRLPDAPNIMFNDINFLLNGPRFDSRREEAASPARAETCPEKVYPGE